MWRDGTVLLELNHRTVVVVAKLENLARNGLCVLVLTNSLPLQCRNDFAVPFHVRGKTDFFDSWLKLKQPKVSLAGCQWLKFLRV